MKNVLQIGDEIASLALRIDIATYRLLVLLREFDELEGWRVGFHSCAEWLSWRTGMNAGAARERVRVARALHGLPCMREALRKGVLSYSKARALTRIATADTEHALVDMSRDTTAAEVEKIVRGSRGMNGERQHARRAMTLHAEADGSVVLRARLTPEAAALLKQALAKAEATLDADTRGAARAVDALTRVAELALGGGGGGGASDAYQVVVHVDAETLGGSDVGMSALESGARVSAETSRRIACDAARIIVVHGKKGQTIDKRTRSRLVTDDMRRRLVVRDRTCRFPGCKSTFCDAHHIQHWADGGPTSLDNLVLVCPRHHRLLHDQKYEHITAVRGERPFIFVADAPAEAPAPMPAAIRNGARPPDPYAPRATRAISRTRFPTSPPSPVPR